MLIQSSAAVLPDSHKVEGSAKVQFELDKHPGELGLHLLCKRVLGGQRLLIASNRGPVTYEQDERGELVARRGSGGVVTALSSLTNYTPVTWVAAALSQADHAMAGLAGKRSADPAVHRNLKLRFVDIEKDTFNHYLNIISNPVLWFIQHEMADKLEKDRLKADNIEQAWKTGYVPANRQFAQDLLDEANQGDTAPFVIFHDYQLYLAPGMVRSQRPDLTLLHFTHIPWPQVAAWNNLPSEIVEAICRSLLACDIVGFQTRVDAENFAVTCWHYLRDVRFWEALDGSLRIERQGHQSEIRSYPISVDPVQVNQTFLSQETRRWRHALKELCQEVEQVIVRVDRLDLSKNIQAGFEAYETLLQSRPELQGKVTFLAMLVPTRESVAEYASYQEQTFSLIERINRHFGTASWQPIHYFYGNDYPRSLAALSLADVMLVNPLMDGMNLVAKEFGLVNERDGVLVLSEKAGAWQELGEAALGVNPQDKAATSQALAQALGMPAQERAKRAFRLGRIVQNNDLSGWLSAHLTDLRLVQQMKTRQNVRRTG